MTHRILLVEDRPQDVRLTQRAIKKAGYAVDVDVAENGREALDRLNKVSGYENAQTPDLVLLDWMMPLVNGQEVLREMKQTPHLKRIPVLVLTTSRSEGDVYDAYGEGCNAYLTKPVNPEQFQQQIEALGLFWLEKALLHK
jgi:two-component system response regulator